MRAEYFAYDVAGLPMALTTAARQIAELLAFNLRRR